MNKVILRPKRDFSIRSRHPWIFSGAIAKMPADAASLRPGETVEVVAAGGETLGYGSWSPASQIRVRMLSFDAKALPDAAFVGDLVACGRQAISAALLKHVSGCRCVAERTDVDVRAKEGLECSDDSDGFKVLEGEEPPELIEIFEGPIRYFVDVRQGHKTGFYLDQRDARAAVGALAKGRDVLNCFCYTGGFGLAAAAGGATHVTQVDVSRDALELAKKNADLTLSGGSVIEQSNNQANRTVFDYVEADVFQYLRRCRDERRTFDLIVLDPPKFASVKSQVMKAARGYKDINLLAMKLLNPNGVLATFSCSGAMTSELFDKILAEAAQDARRDFQVVARTRQGADHPVSLGFPEGLYLKGVILRSLT